MAEGSSRVAAAALSGSAAAVSQAMRIGCAGWSIPKPSAAMFPAEGSHLERYAQVLPATEVNSSFYRPHKPETWARWAASTPPGFRFSAKLPRAITHERRLRDAAEPLVRFLGEVGHLGDRLGPLLVQLPPSLRFDAGVVERFFADLRERFDGALVCEPRHASWFVPEVEAMLAGFQIARVAADPPPVPEAAWPGGWKGLRYWRLHGSPVIYRSKYGPDRLDRLAARLAGEVCSVWCIFDNTADFHAVDDALALLGRVGGAALNPSPASGEGAREAGG